ncbi:helix-turn-helix domain-containing protein [Megamonas funiformis]|jgi:transcriptional regulator with XRE-family HTH domain|uniref:helix-turn-helix domain-containing protein n=1 Tax=Megamonas funiformis TaxID=437897 RepID=UPI00289FBEAE|nr:helix-turn-helix transcriptional regulator [Megamonas funiformis]
MEFKDILKSYRLKSGMTKAEFSRKLGIDSYSTYNNYEVGSSEPKIDMLIKIADLLNISLDNLVGRTPANEDEQLKKEINDLLNIQEFKLKSIDKNSILFDMYPYNATMIVNKSAMIDYFLRLENNLSNKKKNIFAYLIQELYFYATLSNYGEKIAIHDNEKFKQFQVKLIKNNLNKSNSQAFTRRIEKVDKNILQDDDEFNDDF